MKFFLLFFYFTNINHAESQDLCKYFKYCGGSSRTSSQSLPSSSSAANLNPGNISGVRGFGIESIYQPRNPLNINLVTGNGKIGALISPTLENSFFGNRSIEIDDLLFIRKVNKTQYKNKKLSLSVGAKLLDKARIGLDIGISVKRNPDIKKLNPGVGLSARLSFLSFGAYFYQDDVKIDLGNYIHPYYHIPYSIIYNSTTYQEKFFATTYTVGAKIKNLALDFGVIKTRYKFYNEDTLISLYSSSYTYKSFLFNLALRKEDSPNLELVDGMMSVKRKKSEIYYGAEYVVNRYLLVGLQYNNYLLKEWSALVTIFF